MESDHQVKFKFTFEEKKHEKVYKTKEFFDRMIIIEKILMFFEEEYGYIEDFNKLKDNKFIYSTAIEIYTIDENKNNVRYNLIELFFDKTVYNQDIMNDFSSKYSNKSIFLYADLQKEFLNLSKKFRQEITLIYISYHLTKIFTRYLQNVKNLSLRHCVKLKNLYDYFNNHLSDFSQITNNKIENSKYVNLFLNNKKTTFENLKKDLGTIIKEIQTYNIDSKADFNIDKSIIVHYNKDSESVDENNNLEKEICSIFSKLSEAIKSNDKAVFETLILLYNYINQ